MKVTTLELRGEKKLHVTEPEPEPELEELAADAVARLSAKRFRWGGGGHHVGQERRDVLAENTVRCADCEDLLKNRTGGVPPRQCPGRPSPCAA